MITNIVEAIQQHLGYQPLQKVDPNMQEIADPAAVATTRKLPQAAIPAVLAAMIKYSDSKDGINLFKDNSDWLSTIFCGKEKEAITKVASYAGTTESVVESHMENISDEAAKLIKESVTTPDAENLRSYMNAQRHNVLSHLPAALKMGDTLNEETFDDRTNKMEGPVSGFLHRIENMI